MKRLNQFQEQFRSFLITFVRKNPKNRLRVLVADNILACSIVIYALAVSLPAYIVALVYVKLGFLSSQTLENITVSPILVTGICVGLWLAYLVFSILLIILHPSSYDVDDCEHLFPLLETKDNTAAVDEHGSTNKGGAN